MADEAQRLMTISLKKIVESRGRRGGVSLHRNLMIAGVLFKARDVLLSSQATLEVRPHTTKDMETPPTGNHCGSTESLPPADELRQELSSEQVVPSVESDQSKLSEQSMIEEDDCVIDSTWEGKENVRPLDENRLESDVIVADKTTCRSKRRHDVIDESLPVVVCKLAKLDTCQVEACDDAELDVEIVEDDAVVPQGLDVPDCAVGVRVSTSVACSTKQASSLHCGVNTTSPIVCLPRIDAGTNNNWSTLHVRDQLVRPIFVEQVV